MSTFLQTQPPDHIGHWLWGCAREIRRDVRGFLLDVAKTHGDVVRMRYGLIGDLIKWRRRAITIFLNDPADIKHLLITNQHNYPKDSSWLAFPPAVERVFGQGLAFSNAPLHRNQRRIMQPHFHPHKIAVYAEVMAEKTNEMLQDWKEGATLDITEEMTRLTMAIACKAFFNMTLSDQIREMSEVVTVGQQVLAEEYRTVFRFSSYLPTRRGRKFRSLIRRFEDMIFDMIQKRRATDEPPTLVPGQTIVPEPLVTLRPKPGVNVTIQDPRASERAP